MDPDLQIRGGGVVSKKCFSPVLSKHKRGRAPRAPPLDPPLGETLSLNLVLLIVLVLEFKDLSNADQSQCQSQHYMCHQNPLRGDNQGDSGEHGWRSAE